MKNILVGIILNFLIVVMFMAQNSCAATRGWDNECRSSHIIDSEPAERMAFKESGIRLVSSGTLPVELSQSQYGIPVSTATWEESVADYKTYPGHITYEDNTVRFYDASGKLIKQIAKAAIIAEIQKKGGRVPDPIEGNNYLSVSVSTVGYVFVDYAASMSARPTSLAGISLYNGKGERLYQNITHGVEEPESGRYYPMWTRGHSISEDGNFVGVVRGYGTAESLDFNQDEIYGYFALKSLMVLNRNGQTLREIFSPYGVGIYCVRLSSTGHYGIMWADKIILFNSKNGHFVELDGFNKVGGLNSIRFLDDNGNYEFLIETKDRSKYIKVSYRLMPE